MLIGWAGSSDMSNSYVGSDPWPEVTWFILSWVVWLDINYNLYFGINWLQFTEILWCSEYVNLQRFYGALSMSIYRDFMVPQVYQFTDILQRFYGAPSMSISRDLAEILWRPGYVNLRTILRCPEYVNLQRFYIIRLNV